MGGTELGEDLGYGPARGLTAAEVQAVSAALSAISGEQLWSRFDEKDLGSLDRLPAIQDW